MKRLSLWIIVALSLIVIALSMWVVYLLRGPDITRTTQKITSFETCATAGNPITQSLPRQCRDAATGTVYTENISSEQPQELMTRSYTSLKGVKIELNDWSNTKQATSPLTVTGRVPGSWSFEANFGVKLMDNAGTIIAQAPASLQGEWMTDDMVPFTVVLSFTRPSETSLGTIVLQKSNPSGLEQNDDSLTLDVMYK